MPNNFYHTSNQIQTPFNCYFDIYSDKWMYYYSMVFKLKDIDPDVQDDHPLQNISYNSGSTKNKKSFSPW